MRLLMVDNYDSFTFNLVQYLQVLGAEVEVVRNDALTVEAIEKLAPERIVISPGPCTPLASAPPNWPPEQAHESVPPRSTPPDGPPGAGAGPGRRPAAGRLRRSGAAAGRGGA